MPISELDASDVFECTRTTPNGICTVLVHQNVSLHATHFLLSNFRLGYNTSTSQLKRFERKHIHTAKLKVILWKYIVAKNALVIVEQVA